MEGEKRQERNRIETELKGRKTTREGKRRRMKQWKRRKFGCQRKDQELTKAASKKLKVQ